MSQQSLLSLEYSQEISNLTHLDQLRVPLQKGYILK
jgi:hypothetical protein